MPDRKGMCVGWLTRPLEEAELIFFKGIEADDLSSDDCCAICHEPYGTQNEDGTFPEFAVRFPCGHAVGNACLKNWLVEVSPIQGCMFCNKTIVPARYLQEQLNEIWKLVDEMSPEHLRDELCRKTTRGPLTRSMEPLGKYVVEAPSLKRYTHHNARLVPAFQWLLVATGEFLAAVEKYARLSVKTNCHKVSSEALCRRKREFESTYESFQSVVMELATAQMIKEAVE